MLKLVLGRLGSGKTDLLFRAAADAAARGARGQIILVPETHSHTAERRLCELGGPSISLSCEVLTFRRLARRVFAAYGGLSEGSLDEGGRLLLMKTAFDGARTGLRLYGRLSRSHELLESLSDTLDELRACRIGSAQLLSASESCGGQLGQKLSDLALLSDAFDAALARAGADPRDEPARLLDRLSGTGFLSGRLLYVDGFSGFTPIEYAILEELLGQSREVMAAFTCDGLTEGGNGAFEKARRTAARLARSAQKLGIPAKCTVLPPPERAPDLAYLERNVGAYGAAPFDGPCPRIILHAAQTPFSECEYAAFRILGLVRDRGLRFRDIAVVSNDFENVHSTLEAALERYGIPVFLSEKADLLSKPAPALLLSALDIVANGRETDDILSYLKTGLTGIPAEGCDLLENYAYTWRLRGSAWSAGTPWTMNPDGLSKDLTPGAQAQLSELNRLRALLCAPLDALARELAEEDGAAGKAAALYRFTERIGLPDTIAARASELAAAGDLTTADEYRQLWDILCGCLDSFVDNLGDRSVDTRTFADLLRLMLTRYDVGVIPPSLDRVQAGGLELLRAHKARCVIVLDASDGVLPSPGAPHGLLSDADRDVLDAMGYELSDTPETRLSEQENLIYTACATPTALLCLSYSKNTASGAVGRPSYLLARLAALFPRLETTDEASLPDLFRLDAPTPCADLALTCATPTARAAYRALCRLPGFRDRLDGARARAAERRAPLSDPALCDALYGYAPRLTASRADCFCSCHFQYFVRYGLRLKPRRRAALDAPEAGTFLHEVLENTVREVESREGRWRDTPLSEVRKIARSYADRYVADYLGGLSGKSARFVYLFERLRLTLDALLESLHAEFNVSLFRPLDFELDFSAHGDLPPVRIPLGGGVEAELSGKVDRVDGWLHDGALYLRVIDYKSGVKSFSLAEIYQGLGLQMPVYLLALQRDAGQYLRRHPELAGQDPKILPAGLLYAPARSPVLSAPRSLDDEELKPLLDAELARSGMVLDDPAVIGAMEPDAQGRFIPVKLSKNGAPLKSSSVASGGQFELLFRHVTSMLRGMAREMREGRIDAAPLFRTPTSGACDFCDFSRTCHFDRSGGADRPRYLARIGREEFFDAIARGGEDV